MDHKVFSTEQYVNFFLEELYSVTHFRYEHDPEAMGFFEEDDPYTDHIIAAQEHLKEYMLASIKGSSQQTASEEIQKLYEEKKEEVFDIVLPEIEKYIQQKVTVDIIWPDSLRLADDGGDFKCLKQGADDNALSERKNDAAGTDYEKGQPAP